MKFSTHSLPFSGNFIRLTCLTMGLLVCLLQQANSQLVTNYAFSPSSGAFTALAGGTSPALSGGSLDEGFYNNIPIGFTFYYMGNAYNTVSASTNGWMTFGQNITSAGLTNNLSAGTPRPLVAPLWDDNEISATGTNFTYLTTGSAGSRIFTVEWLNEEWNFGAAGPVISHQVKLYEATGAVEFVYRQEATAVNSGSASIGITAIGTGAGNFLSLDGTGVAPLASSTTETTSLATKPATGQVYTFTPPAIVPASPTTITFTAVGLTGMTVGWTDNSTDETSFSVFRSTDNVTFTPVANVASTTSAGTGMAYSSILTGLTPGTTYFFRVTANTEGRASAPLSGSQATNAGAVSGTKTIPGDYPTLTAAFADINLNGLSGAVNLVLQAAYSSAAETFPLVPPGGTITSAINTITIFPAVTGLSITSANTTGTFNFNNSKFVTIDGRVGATGTTKDLVVENTATAGFAIQFINDAINNTIKYCKVRGINTTTTNGVIRFSTTTGTSGNSNNTIDNNDISDAASGTPNNCIYAAGTASVQNNNISITNNNIFNYFTSASTGNEAGINIAANNTNWTISGNSFYQTVARSHTGTGTFNAILCSSTTSGPLTITNNFIGGSGPGAGGGAMTYTTNGQLRAIQLTVISTSPTSIQGNTIANISLSTASTGTSHSAISLLTGPFNVGTTTGNTIGSQSTTGNITFSSTGTVTTVIFSGILAGTGTGGVTNISNNTVGGIAVSVTSTGAVSLRGIGFQGTTGTFTVSNNTIGSPTTENSISNSSNQSILGIFGAASITTATQTISNNLIANLTQTGTSTGNALIGIHAQGATGGIYNMTGNTVRDLTSASTAGGSIAGINAIAATTAGQSVTQNTVHSLNNISGGATTSVNGIVFSSPATGTNLVARNLVHSLNAASATAVLNGIAVTAGSGTIQNNMVRLGIIASGADLTTALGINAFLETGGTNNFFHNSAYVGGAGVGAGTSNTFAFSSGVTTNTRNFLNNIFFNARSNGASTGKHYGITVAGTAPNPAGLTSNFNDLFVTGTGGFTGLFNALDQLTLTDWQTATGQDGGSVSGNPQFINPTGSSALLDLHINSSTPTPIEGIGTATSVADDFDGQVRSTLTPIDLGADAGNFTAAAANCSGAPTAGTTNSSVNPVCPGTNFTLSLTGTTSGVLGLTFQWQSSPTGAGGSYANIGGATNASLVTSQTTATFYQCVVTCSFSGMSANSTPLQVTMSSFLNCYCGTTYPSGCGTDAIVNVNLDGSPVMTNATGCAPGSYTYFTPTPTTTLTAGNIYNLAITFGTDPSQFSAAWIDFNQNGVLEASENIGLSTTSPGASGTTTFSFTVPVGATTGLTRLRIRGGDDVALTTAQACGASNNNFGETEDYDITIAAPVGCAGAPTAGTTASTATAVCSGVNFTLSLTGATSGLGITYQWQSSATGAGGSYVNIGGATNSTLVTSQTAATFYQCIVTCTNGGASATSTPLQVTMLTGACLCAPYCTPTSSGTACLTNVTFNTINNTTAGCSGTNYSLESATTSVTAGTAHDLTVTTDASAIVSVWIDYNQDGTFAADEHTQVYTTGTTGTVNITIPVAAMTGETRMRVRSRLSGNTNGPGDACTVFGSGEAEDYCITITAPVGCAGAPTAGTTASTINPVCSGVNFTLSLTGATSGSGITYQWQSSPTGAGGSYVNIVGATNSTLVTSQTTATFYQCIVTCTNGGASATSTPLQVTMNTLLNCYCATTYANGCGSGDAITNVNLDGSPTMTNATGCAAGAYTYFTPTPTTTLIAGNTYMLAVTMGTDGNQFCAAWIDYNNDGILDAGENIGISGNAGASGTATLTFTVPTTATGALTRLRVRGGNDSALTAAQACGTSSSGFGETEDYDITISIPAGCLGAPTAGATVSTANPVCPDANFTLSLPTATTGVGITYQWQSSATGTGGSYANIGGATSSTLATTQTAATFYQCIVTCTNSGQSATSTPLQVTMETNVDNCYCSAGATILTDEKISNVAFADINNPSTSTAGYENFTSVTGNVQQGQTYTFTGSLSNGFSQDEMIVWIDLNHDGDFTDLGEEVFNSAIGAGPFSGPITIPGTATLGNTRMRVRLHDTSSLPNVTPCGNSDYGQVEDYTLNIALPPTCPVLTTAPANVSIINSTCQSPCTVSGGSIVAPGGTPCPAGSTLQYSTDGTNWSTTIPVYAQTGPAQSIQTRCRCDSDPLVFSPSSAAETTVPGACTTPGSPTISITNNVCPALTGSISASGCGAGTVVEYATAEVGPFSTTAPAYTTTPFTVFARCRNTTTDCVSTSVSMATAPNACLAIAATDATKPEGNVGTTAFTFTVTRTGNTSGASSAAYAVTGSGGNPANAADFGGTLPSGTVNFAAGETSMVITINVSGDTNVEPDEGFTVTLSAPAGAVISTATATGTIQNDDVACPTVAQAFINEFHYDNAGTDAGEFIEVALLNSASVNVADLTLTLYNGSNGASYGTHALSTFTAGTNDGTYTYYTKLIAGIQNGNPDGFALSCATGLIQFISYGGTFAAADGPANGQTSTDVGVVETTTTLVGSSLQLIGTTWVLTCGSNTSGTTNAQPIISIAATDANKPEGNPISTTAFTFTVTRSGLTTGETTLNFAVTGSSGSPANAADFGGGILPSSTVSFAAGETSKVITINVNGDSDVEPNEGFTVTLTNTAGCATNIMTATATGTIQNDDSSLSIAATDANKPEGNVSTTAFTFTVTRTGLTTGTASASYAVTGNGANPANAADFGGAFPSGTVNFAAGETSKVITINVSGDTDVEPDEGFTVTLSAPVGATLGTATATGTIQNDDVLPTNHTIAATDAVKAEGNVGNTAFTFTVTRTGTTTGASSVDYAVTGSGANPANAADFGGAFASGTVNFAAGETSKVVTINVSGDTSVEPDEGFTVTISNPIGGSITTATATGTIQNDDASLGIAATDAVKAEGNVGNTAFTFTVTRTGLTTGTASASYAVTGSGANPANAADFGGTLPSGTVNFAAGETSKVITINVSGDTGVEPDESFTVTLSAPVGATLGTATATGTIQNDDASLGIAATDANKAEGNVGNTAFTFTVTRTGLTTGTASASYAVTGSGANPANAADFGGTLPSGTVNFAAGETSKVITINVSGDTSVEPDEGFTVTLSAPVGATLGTATATGTILNDDATAPTTYSIAATDAIKLEGNVGFTAFTFTVTRGGTTTGSGTVDFSVAGSGANPANAADFGGAFPSGTVNFAAGETSKVITVNVSGDTSVEPDEGFTVTLSNPVGGTITTATATGVIQNDDAACPTVAQAFINEFHYDNTGTDVGEFVEIAVLNSAAVVLANVTLTTYNGSNGLQNGTHPLTTFTAGTNDGTFTYYTKLIAGLQNDSEGLALSCGGTAFQFLSYEGSFMALDGPANGQTATDIVASEPSATLVGSSLQLIGTTWVLTCGSNTSGTTNAQPVISIVATDANKAEGNAGTTAFTFTVTRSGLTTGETTLNFAVTGSSGSPANAADFGGTLPSGTVSFAAGETSKVITINVSGDTDVEPNEGFTVTLTNQAGCATNITTAAATGTIQNDDSTAPTILSIAATDAVKPEGNAGNTAFTFTVTRTGTTTGASSVSYAVTGSGANPANAADFGGTLPSGTVNFAAGETSKVVTVNVSGDTSVEPDEGFTVTLSAPVGATLGTATATGTIQNDDVLPTILAIAATDAVKPEGNAGNTAFTFTVTRTGTTTGTSSVSYAVTGSGANPANAADFGGTLPSGTVSFAAGETSKVITINVSGDTSVEPDEGFTVTLSAPVGATLGTATANGTIQNDDVPPCVVTINSIVVTNENCPNNSNGSITINATIVTGSGQLFYSINGGMSFSGSNTFINVAPGTYNIVVVLQGNNCTATGTATVLPAASGTLITWYKDLDNDGYSDGLTVQDCVQPAGFKMLGQLAGPPSGATLDCNDNDPLQRPGQTWYLDADNDGYSTGSTLVQCLRPVNYKAAVELLGLAIDCNDANATIYPGAPELCDGLDNDCDNLVDEGAAGGLTYQGNVTFMTQAQVNAFSQCYSIINGNLLIKNAGITSLANLINIVQVTGNVTIQSTGLANLTGLGNLAIIGGNLVIAPHATSLNLTSLNGLGGVMSVGGNLLVYSNTELTNCCAIQALANETGGHSVGGTISIYSNACGCDALNAGGSVPAACAINGSCAASPIIVPGGGSGIVDVQVDHVQQGVDIFPNPADGELNVEIRQEFRSGMIRLFDLRGSLLFERELEGGTMNYRYPVDNLRNGIYLVDVLLDGEHFAEKLVIE